MGLGKSSPGSARIEEPWMDPQLDSRTRIRPAEKASFPCLRIFNICYMRRMHCGRNEGGSSPATGSCMNGYSVDWRVAPNPSGGGICWMHTFRHDERLRGHWTGDTFASGSESGFIKVSISSCSSLRNRMGVKNSASVTPILQQLMANASYERGPDSNCGARIAPTLGDRGGNRACRKSIFLCGVDMGHYGERTFGHEFLDGWSVYDEFVPALLTGSGFMTIENVRPRRHVAEQYSIDFLLSGVEQQDSFLFDINCKDVESSLMQLVDNNTFIRKLEQLFEVTSDKGTVWLTHKATSNEIPRYLWIPPQGTLFANKTKSEKNDAPSTLYDGNNAWQGSKAG
ncbi:hypothetical protein EDC04DRAFT_3093431 [Pisolithus marmoratus]|nr:hypothetical protein EDC04DRAFT_3093431 [Pisolithus marmoratus]